MNAVTIVLVLLAVLAIATVSMTVKIVPQARAGIVERFGKYRATLSAGLNVVAYEYMLDWESELKRVEAGPDGVAVFDWTPTQPGVGQLLVRGVYADGSVSELTQDVFVLIN